MTAPADPRDFLDGLHTLGGAGDPASRRGYAIHRYAANRDMDRRAFVNADGDLLLVPEHGDLTIHTELGPLDVAPGQIAILPAGIAFAVQLHGPDAWGTVGEAFGGPWRLPERGPAGANGLTDPRHFRAPAAWFEDYRQVDFRLVAKLGGRLHEASLDHSPFDVVAWHGNHVPYVYDLHDFSPLNSVGFDHPDPSIYCVVSSPGLDFILFPPRWDVASHTFRPPFFHRNVVTELNGIIRAHPSPGSPFRPGALFLTPSLTAHGPGGREVERVLALSDDEADRPSPPRDELWFQFEGALPMSLSPWGEQTRLPQWPATWGSHRARFTRS
jgi:homogentisate 1,2-dioxygenase